MKAKFRTLIIFLTLWMGGADVVAEDAEPLENWHKLSTPHIVLYTDYDVETARDVIENLSIFRHVILQFMKGVEKPESQPLNMVLFRSQTLWRKHPLSDRVGGYFSFPIYGPLAVVGANGGAPNVDTIYHEYVHYLVNQFVPVRFPEWYNEGMAEFFSSMAIEPDYVYIGAVPIDSAKQLEKNGLLAPSRLFSQTRIANANMRERAKFYPSAWLTSHYFTLGARNGFPSHYQSNIAFMDKVRNGMPVEEAFTSSFSISMRELDRELRRYARSKSKTGFAIDRPKMTSAIDVQPLSSAQAKVKLATVFGWREEGSIGHQFLLSAAAQQDPLALSIRAVQLAMDEQIAESEAALDALPEEDELDAPVLFNIFNARQKLAQQIQRRGQVDLANQQYQQALHALELSLDMSPYMPSMLSDVVRLSRQSDKQETEAAIDRLLAQFGNHYMAQLEAAKAYAQLEQIDASLARINKAIELLPHDADATKMAMQIMREVQKIGLSDSKAASP